MYRWRKFTSPQWLARHEAILQEQTNYGLAVIESPNRKGLRLEVSSSSRQKVQPLLVRYGGAIEHLLQNWRSSFAASAQTKPLRIGNRLTIRSTRRSVRSKSRMQELIIPAAGAFGTGGHATTAMCLRLLEQSSRNLPEGWSILDLGTGTGILALAARCLGAGHVVAIDNDPRAIGVARSNGRLNRRAGVQFEIADATRYKTRKRFDIIVANLFSELLIKMIPTWRLHLKPGGNLILSGILRDQEREVVRTLRNCDLTTGEIRRRGKWIAIRARHQKAG